VSVEKLLKFAASRRCTILGIGPMSRTCVEVSVDIANKYDVPIMLIASRRQIDSPSFGGGYVNNWTTSEFANFVESRDQKANVVLARDHGGPWQNLLEISEKMTLAKSMESCKRSYENDIDSGLSILHIDPSVDPSKSLNVNEILDRIYDLYEHCWAYAQRTGKQIAFEIGTEEQSGGTNTPAELEYVLEMMKRFTMSNKLPMPHFVVIQSGTRVMELRNVGSFDSPIRVSGELPVAIQIPLMIDICKKYGVFMKEHNTDYLSDEALSWHPRLGIHSANVAPEFGAAESMALIDCLERNRLNHLSDEFVRIVVDSNKWLKWMLPNSDASNREKAMIAGHYCFSTVEGSRLIALATEDLARLGINLDNVLRNAVERAIMRYLVCFRIITTV